MADEPSIDEILASLDRLLNEGEGRNDEPAPSSHPPAADAPTEAYTEAHAEAHAEESAEAPVEAPVEEAAEPPGPGFFKALDHAVSEPYNEAWGDEPGDAAAADQADEAPAPADAAVEAGRDAADQPGSKRVVLTDAMLVEDVQQSLPLALGDTRESESARDPASVPGAASEGEMWSEQDVQALVDQVTDDVCSAMAEQLPEMIREALARRLSAFIDDRQHQDSGPEE
jgi:hypothetical protein